MCSVQGTELSNEGVAGRAERLHSIRKVKEDSGRFFPENLKRQEPELCNAKKEP